MRHYEIVFMVHPDQSEQVPGMLERYSNIVKQGGGQIHRTEDWGRRQLAYPINNMNYANYVHLDVKIEPETLNILEEKFKYDQNVFRHLTVKLGI